MTADIRTAAQRHVNGQVTEYAREWFADGAVWAAARVTPTREQIEDVLRKSGAWCGDCNFEMDHCSGCKHVREVYAESVLRLIQELAEGESDGSDS